VQALSNQVFDQQTIVSTNCFNACPKKIGEIDILDNNREAKMVEELIYIPLVSILSNFSGFVHSKPAYLFLLIRRYG
jgi:hypothetical protein